MFEILTPSGEWPKSGGVFEMEFETSSWYPTWLCYVPPGEKFSRAIIETGEQYRSSLGYEAQFAFVRKIPQGAEEFMDIGGLTLVQAAWVQERFIVVCHGGKQSMKSGFQSWSKVGGAL